MNRPEITVTVAGKAGAGKSTVAEAIAQELKQIFGHCSVIHHHGPEGPPRVPWDRRRNALMGKGVTITVLEQDLHVSARERTKVTREELIFGEKHRVDIAPYAAGLTTEGKWFWDCYYGDPAPAKSYVLPTELFILLEGGALYQHAHDQFYTIEYPTEAMAKNALRRAFAIAKLTRENRGDNA